MATDINKIIKNLLEFYDFNDQTVVSIGAGGGQLIGYGHSCKKVIAIDNNQEAIETLENRLRSTGLSGKFELINADFHKVATKGDMVLFEFCLHEMDNPLASIEHALNISRNIIVADHWPSSEWAYIVDEDEKVKRSWETITKRNPKKIQKFDSVQFFNDYQELYQKVKVQGDRTIERIKPYFDKKDFSIPMSYGFALI